METLEFHIITILMKSGVHIIYIFSETILWISLWRRISKDLGRLTGPQNSGVPLSDNEVSSTEENAVVGAAGFARLAAAASSSLSPRYTD